MNEYQHYLIDEFATELREHRMSRRDLVRRAVLIMATAPAGLAALAAVGCGGDDDDNETATAAATEVASPSTGAPSSSATVGSSPATADAGDIEAHAISFDGPGSQLLGYLARPKDGNDRTGIVVIHENRGLVEHIRDVARRYAREGFVALAVDLVSRDGGSKDDEALNTGFLGRADVDDLIADMKAYVAFLQDQKGVRSGGVGVTGSCFGGMYTWETLIASDDVTAAVPYYGRVRLMDQVATTKAAVFAIYGELDTGITGQAEQVRAELAKTGRPFDIQIYPGARYAFFNDTRGSYNQTAAEDAWMRTLAWFREQIG